MAIIAIVRVSGIRHHGTIDYTWIFFWQHIEVCIAVSMFSFTAFRSLFVTTSQEAVARKAKPWYSSTPRKLRGIKGARLQNEGPEKLPSIPSATMTGIRTFIRGSRRGNTLDSEAGQEHSDDIPLRNQDHITVTSAFSSELQSVREASILRSLAADEQFQVSKHQDSTVADFV